MKKHPQKIQSLPSKGGEKTINNVVVKSENQPVKSLEKLPESNVMYIRSKSQPSKRCKVTTSVRKSENPPVKSGVKWSDVNKLKYHGPVPQKDVSQIMKDLIRPKQIDLPEIKCRTDLSVTGLGASADGFALKLMPDDVPDLPRHAFPIFVGGDDNCLSRCGSLLAYGSEMYHLDIRLRIAIEFILSS